MSEEFYDMTGKVIILTGANSGIGKRSTIALAKLGATVIMACRSQERGEKALSEVKEITGSEKVELMLVDMSLQRSIRDFVKKFKEKYENLHVLIHNAANFDQRMKRVNLTEDGVEVIFATNHLGPFLMTHLLLDTLKASAPSRIINVSSRGLSFFPRMTIHFDDLYQQKRKKFSVMRAYYHSKMAHVMFTYDLARKLEGTGVTVNVIRVPNVKIDWERLDGISKLKRGIYHIKRSFGITPEKMAETYVYLACDPELETVTGKIFSNKNKEVKSSKRSYDEDVWDRLWDLSEKLTGLK